MVKMAKVYKRECVKVFKNTKINNMKDRPVIKLAVLMTYFIS